MYIEMEQNGIKQEIILTYNRYDILEDLDTLKDGFRELVVNNKLKEIFLFDIDG